MRGEAEVRLFQEAMLRELQANAYKGDWRCLMMSRRKHFYEIDYHLAKLKAAVKEGDTIRVLEFSADIANHVLFLADSEGALTTKVLEARRAEPSFVKPKIGVYFRLLRNPRWIRKGWGGFRNRLEAEDHIEPALSGVRDVLQCKYVR